MFLKRFLTFYPKTHPQVFLYTLIHIFVYPPNLHSEFITSSKTTQKQGQNEKTQRCFKESDPKRKYTRKKYLCVQKMSLNKIFKIFFVFEPGDSYEKCK